MLNTDTPLSVYVCAIQALVFIYIYIHTNIMSFINQHNCQAHPCQPILDARTIYQ